MQAFLNATWFQIGNQDFTYGQVLFSLIFICIVVLLFWFVTRRVLPSYFEKTGIDRREARSVRLLLVYTFIYLTVWGLLTTLGLDRTLFENQQINFRISTLLQALLIVQIARIIDWIISRVFIQRFYERRDRPTKHAPKEPQSERSTNRIVQAAVYVLAIILILTSFQIDYVITTFTSKSGVAFELRISNIFKAILVLLVARILIWVLTQLVLYGYYKRKAVDQGSQFAYNQLLTYVVYVIAILIAITQLGVNPTLIWGGLAALAVGIGLGLQQTFNDFFSGIILLFERSVEIGDILELQGGLVGTVSKIGIRASIVNTRDNVTVVVPNSKLVTDNVINWSHFDDKVRFFITVDVAYGTDLVEAKRILLEVTRDNPHLIDFPAPFVRVRNFADSGITMELHFWSREMIFIEDIKSDLRIRIDQLFRQARITIPFPQRDVWMHTPPGTFEGGN